MPNRHMRHCEPLEPGEVLVARMMAMGVPVDVKEPEPEAAMPAGGYWAVVDGGPSRTLLDGPWCVGRRGGANGRPKRQGAADGR